MTDGVAAAPERLRGVPLFADLDEAALARIAALCTEFEAPANQVLVQPGMPASGLFVIEDGSVVVERGSRKVELGPGQFFGEIALLVPDSGRTARVKTTSVVRCIAIDRFDLEKMLHQEPSIALVMLRTLARRLADTTNA